MTRPLSNINLALTRSGPLGETLDGPLEIGDIVGWWDASHVASRTVDGSGDVTALADRSGNGYTMSAASGAVPLDGNWLDYDGSTASPKFLQSSETSAFSPGLGTAGFTAYVVLKTTDTGTNAPGFSAGDDTDRWSVGVNFGAANQVNANIGLGGSNFNNLSATQNADDGQAVLVVCRRFDSTWELHTSGANLASPIAVRATGGYGATNDVQLVVGPRIGAFNEIGGAFFDVFNGQIGECGYFSRDLTDGELDTLLAYVASKWQV